MVHDQVPYTVCLSTDYLWDSYSPNKDVVTEVKQYLVETLWLSKDGKWNEFGGAKINEKRFATRRTDSSEDKTFKFFSRLFNTVLEYLRQSERGTPVEEMVHAGYVEPESTRFSGNRPNAFLRMVTETPPTPGKVRWRDLTCPFEYKFGDSNAVDNDVKALWSLHHIMRSDPCRMFSFGSTVYGTMFRIWLMCRAALFTFIPFDWFEDPDSLLKFFVILATSSKADLGFDTNIESAGETDFDLQFTIDRREYRTSKLLYDIGADTPTGRGTWVFEVVDEETKEVRVIKDCWVEDRPGKQMEHEIIAGIKHDMNNEEFREHFVDICGHRKTDMSGGFGKICKILETKTFVEKEVELNLIVPTSGTQQATYTGQAKDSIADQHHRLWSTEEKKVPENPPHPRFRYQVVYNEKGTSLFEVTSFKDVFSYIGQAAEALHRLHQAGWVHRDFSPGNVITVEGKAKISDLEFAKRRVADDLEKLTRPGDVSSAAKKDLRTGTLYFTALEVEKGHYMFRPLRWGSSMPTLRTFLHNPLHDYESVWWTALWFVFFSKPEGVPENVMEEAQESIYERRDIFLTNFIGEACMLLPVVLRPLGDVLVEMREILLDAYRSFEEAFDGSKLLPVFLELKRCLQLLVEKAHGLDVTPPVVSRKLNTVDMKQLNLVEGQGQQDQEEGRRVGRQVMDPDNPFIGKYERGVYTLGKTAFGGSPKADDMLMTKKLKEGSV